MMIALCLFTIACKKEYEYKPIYYGENKIGDSVLIDKQLIKIQFDDTIFGIDSIVLRYNGNEISRYSTYFKSKRVLREIVFGEDSFSIIESFWDFSGDYIVTRHYSRGEFSGTSGRIRFLTRAIGLDKNNEMSKDSSLLYLIYAPYFNDCELNITINGDSTIPFNQIDGLPYLKILDLKGMPIGTFAIQTSMNFYDKSQDSLVITSAPDFVFTVK